MFNKFNEIEISEVYQSIKKDDNYLSKYDVLSEDDKSFLDDVFSHPLYKWDVRDYTRIRTIFDFREWIEKYKITSENLAYTHIDDPELKLINYNNSTLIEYKSNDFSGDLHELNEIEKFDFFLFNQTLEHLYNPFVAVKNIYDSLVDGGYVFTSVPTLNIPHSTPIHFNGLNPMGLGMLFKSCGFDIVEIGQWGNYEYLTKLFSNHTWPGYSHLSTNGIINEERNVTNCWILAKKIKNKYG
jgi:hypothetical protein